MCSCMRSNASYASESPRLARMTISVSGGRPTTDAYTPPRPRRLPVPAAITGPVDGNDANRPPRERHPRVGLHDRPPERSPRGNDAHTLSGVHLVAGDAAAPVDDGVPLDHSPLDADSRPRWSRPVEPTERKRRAFRIAGSDVDRERARHPEAVADRAEQHVPSREAAGLEPVHAAVGEDAVRGPILEPVLIA